MLEEGMVQLLIEFASRTSTIQVLKGPDDQSYRSIPSLPEVTRHDLNPNSIIHIPTLYIGFEVRNSIFRFLFTNHMLHNSMIINFHIHLNHHILIIHSIYISI